MLEVAGCSRVISMDLHSPQIQGFFRIPADNLLGLKTLGDQVLQDGVKNIVVAADTDFADEAQNFLDTLGLPSLLG